MKDFLESEEKLFDEFVEKYQLFTNENYADNLPYDSQQESVKTFLHASHLRLLEHVKDQVGVMHHLENGFAGHLVSKNEVISLLTL